MYRASLFAVVVVAGIVVLFAATRGDAQAQGGANRTLQKWEYRLLTEVDLNDFYRQNRGNQNIANDRDWADKALSGMGAQGWELIVVEREKYYFKRPTP